MNPYQIRGDIGAYEIVDSRTGRIAHTFKFHPDAESCKDSMNEWVSLERRAANANGNALLMPQA